jgi:hypothetical protein
MRLRMRCIGFDARRVGAVVGLVGCRIVSLVSAAVVVARRHVVDAGMRRHDVGGGGNGSIVWAIERVHPDWSDALPTFAGNGKIRCAKRDRWVRWCGTNPHPRRFAPRPLPQVRARCTGDGGSGRGENALALHSYTGVEVGVDAAGGFSADAGGGFQVG